MHCKSLARSHKALFKHKTDVVCDRKWFAETIAFLNYYEHQMLSPPSTVIPASGSICLHCTRSRSPRVNLVLTTFRWIMRFSRHVWRTRPAAPPTSPTHQDSRGDVCVVARRCVNLTQHPVWPQPKPNLAPSLEPEGNSCAGLIRGYGLNATPPPPF